MSRSRAAGGPADFAPILRQSSDRCSCRREAGNAPFRDRQGPYKAAPSAGPKHRSAERQRSVPEGSRS